MSCVFFFFQEHSLQQRLGLAGRVVGTEVLVFLHFLLQREQLTLEFAAQTRQRVPDVVGQLLGTRQTQFRQSRDADLSSLFCATIDRSRADSRPGSGPSVDAVSPCARLCVCRQGGRGRTSSLQPERRECPSSHRCLSGYD